MTTIAWDGHVLATDSLASTADSVICYKTKIIEINDTWLTGAGRASSLYHMAACIREGKPIPDGLDVCAYHLGSDFIHRYEDNSYPEPLDINEIFTDGSGWKWARAALEFGMTVVEAVEYAIKKDCASGGKVNWVEIIPRQ